MTWTPHEGVGATTPDVLTPYHQLLGESYNHLQSQVRRAHEAPLSAAGAMDVVHGDHLLTPVLVRIMKLPERGANVPVVLNVTNERGGDESATMVWRRQIGATILDTRQFARNGRLVEQSGPGTVEFALQSDNRGSLHYSDVACRFMGVPIPRLLAPRVQAQVSADGDGWHVGVNVQWHGRDHGFPAWVLSGLAIGVFLSGVRDAVASIRKPA